MTESSGISPGNPNLWRRWISLLLVVPIASFSWLTVFRAPTNKLWYAAIIYTEAGVVLGVVLVVGCLVVERKYWYGKLVAVFGLLGLLFLVAPWTMAFQLANPLKARLDLAFGKQKALSGPQAPGQSKPLMLGRIFGTKSPGVKRTSYSVQVPGKKLQLDLYQRPGGKKPQPLFVVIHGGAWRTGSPRLVTAINKYLAARGVTVASISYRFAPKYKFPTQLNDVKTMLEWLRARATRLQINPQRIVLMGRSAGGHLATLAGYRQIVPGIKGVINFYGPTDMHWSWANPSNPWVINSPKVLREFLGGTPTQARKAYDDASPIRFVNTKSPPTLLIYGVRDEVVSRIHGRRLAKQLQRAKIKHFHLELPWATHGCDAVATGPCWQISTYAIERFLRATLFQ